jgi:hypothetical protein
MQEHGLPCQRGVSAYTPYMPPTPAIMNSSFHEREDDHHCRLLDNYNLRIARFFAAVPLPPASALPSPLAFFMTGLPHFSALDSFRGLPHGVQLPTPCLAPSGIGRLLAIA